MSILKGILHHWNKTTQSYDTIHPETEVSQVTDWNQGIVNTLASTGLSSLVNVLSSDSLLALLIKKVFDAMGVKYSLGQNGYVCFGSFYGGLIIQWGYNNGTNFSSGEKEISISFPITFLTMAVTASAVHHKYASKSSNDLIEIKSLSTDSMKLSIRDAKDVNTPVSTYCYWFAIGI